MLNMAIVGLGRWGERLVDAVHTPASAKLRFTHAMARTPDRVHAFCSARGIRVVGDLAQVLHDPEVGAVALATPHSLHAEQVAVAAAAGKHVFVEKPFTLDAAGAMEAARACANANVVLALGHNRRFLPAIAEMKRIVAAGELGDIMHVEGNFSGNSGLRYKPGEWRASEAESPLGGMAGMGIHLIDTFIHLVGPIDAVRCESHRVVVKVAIDDTTSVFMRFANGATGCLSTLMATGRMFRLQVFGTRGWLHLLDNRHMDIGDRDGNVRHVEFPQVDIERAELEAFADAVAGMSTYPVPVHEAIHGIAVMDAAMRSAASDGERVAVDSRDI